METIDILFGSFSLVLAFTLFPVLAAIGAGGKEGIPRALWIMTGSIYATAIIYLVLGLSLSALLMAGAASFWLVASWGVTARRRQSQNSVDAD